MGGRGERWVRSSEMEMTSVACFPDSVTVITMKSLSVNGDRGGGGGGGGGSGGEELVVVSTRPPGSQLFALPPHLPSLDHVPRPPTHTTFTGTART